MRLNTHLSPYRKSGRLSIFKLEGEPQKTLGELDSFVMSDEVSIGSFLGLCLHGSR